MIYGTNLGLEASVSKFDQLVEIKIEDQDSLLGEFSAPEGWFYFYSPKGSKDIKFFALNQLFFNVFTKKSLTQILYLINKATNYSMQGTYTVYGEADEVAVFNISSEGKVEFKEWNKRKVKGFFGKSYDKLELELRGRDWSSTYEAYKTY